jgi:O-antigen/teichoic acid export membrane protein
VLAAFTPELASRSLAAPHLVLELRIGALLLFFNAVNGTQLGILAGLEAFQAIAQVNLLRSLLSLPLVVTGLLLGRLVGAVAALAVAAAVGCLINQIVVQAQCRRVEIPLQYRAITSQLPILWRFSLPAFLSGGLVGQVSWLANAMLVNQPNGYAEMGVFNAANQWRSAVLFLPHLISQVAVPILSSIQAAGDTPRLRSVLLGSMLTNAACALPLVLILFASSSLIMSLYGEQFTQRAAVLQVSLVSAALLAIQTPIGNVITAYGRMWLGFLMNAGWAACFLLTARWLLALGWGAQALASAYLAAYLVHALWTHWFAASVLSHRNHTQLAPAERTTIDAQPI